MVTVGEFARLSAVSVRTLHHYDAIGLLSPASVDPVTGYRRYELRSCVFSTASWRSRISGFRCRRSGPFWMRGSSWVSCAVEVRRGRLAFDYPGFVHTVLADMRARLAASDCPDRIFEVTLEAAKAAKAAKAAGLIGRKRVLDSTPLYDAVATMDTVTLIRSWSSEGCRCGLGSTAAGGHRPR